MTVYCSLLTLTDKSLLSVTIILKPNAVLGDLNTAISIVMLAIRPLTVLYINSMSVYIHSHTDNDDDHAKMLTRQTSVTIIYLFIYVAIILEPNVVLHDLNTTLLIVMMWITIRPATVLYVNSTSGYIQTDIMMTC